MRCGVLWRARVVASTRARHIHTSNFPPLLSSQGSDFTLPNGGVVKLSRGIAKLRVQRADYVARLAAQAGSLDGPPRSPKRDEPLDLGGP